MIPNQPLILSSTATSSWAARENWASCAGGRTAEAGPSKPRINALRRYAHHAVPVANTLKQEFSEFERTERPLGEVLDLWEANSPEGRGLYVKDWHLLGEIENEGRGAEEVYHVPKCFRGEQDEYRNRAEGPDDWMNPSFCAGPRSLSDHSRPSDACDDFRFCYIGPAGTFTPLHRDVYSSYSWSANIVGRKRWWLFPPDRLDGLKDRHGEFVFDIRTLEGEGRGIQIIQQEGEVIFMPSGWYHQVENLDFVSCSTVIPAVIPADNAVVHIYQSQLYLVCDVVESLHGAVRVATQGRSLYQRYQADDYISAGQRRRVSGRRAAALGERVVGRGTSSA